MLHRLIPRRNAADAIVDPSPLDLGLGFTIRFARPEDDGRLRRLAAFDSQRPLTGQALVAEVDGELWAAVSVETSRMVADPFHHTATLVAVLEQRAADLAARSDHHRTNTQPSLRPAFR